MSSLGNKFRKLENIIETEVLAISKPVKTPKVKDDSSTIFKKIAENPKVQKATMKMVEEIVKLIYSEKYGDVIIPENKEVIYWTDIVDIDEFIRIHLKDKTEKKIKQIIRELEFGFGWNTKNGSIEP